MAYINNPFTGSTFSKAYGDSTPLASIASGDAAGIAGGLAAIVSTAVAGSGGSPPPPPAPTSSFGSPAWLIPGVISVGLLFFLAKKRR